jgi:RHS repeat-associated protein
MEPERVSGAGRGDRGIDMKSSKLARLAAGAGLALQLLCLGAGSVQAQTLYFIQADHLNTPRLITNSAGAAVWRWDNQEPFGNDVPNENPSGLGTLVVPLRFPGQYFDRETNLAYNYFRTYDPGIGRYVQFDPIGLRGGRNGYLYVAANPLRYIDPLALIPICQSVILNISQSNYQDIVETLIWMQRFYAPGPPKPTIGPPIIPPIPPYPPVAPKPDFDWIPYDLEFLRLDIYQVSEIIRNLLVTCTEILRDKCGRVTVFTTSFNQTEREQTRNLIDTQHRFRITKPDGPDPGLQ